MRGSAIRTATAHEFRQAVLADRADPPLGQRPWLPLPAGDGVDLVSAATVGARGAPAADQGHAFLGWHRLGVGTRNRGAPRRPAWAAAHGARARDAAS